MHTIRIVPFRRVPDASAIRSVRILIFPVSLDNADALIDGVGNSSDASGTGEVFVVWWR